MKKKLLRWISLFVVASLLLSSAPSQAQLGPRGSDANVPAPVESNEGRQVESMLKLLQELQGLKVVLTALQDRAQGGQRIASELTVVSACIPEIKELDREVQTGFEDTEQKLIALLEEGKISAEKLQRHRDFTADFKQGMESLYDALEALSPTREVAALSMDLLRVQEALEKVAPTREAPLEGVRTERGPKRDEPIQQEAWSGTSPLSYVSPTTLTFDPPTGADLDPTIDVQFTQALIDLAASLGNDPVQIYEYVHNNFFYEPYYGSWRGSHETLLEEAGNDYDLSSLTIALLRTSDIPARYITGTIRIPTAEAMNLVGIQYLPTAAEVFGDGGILETWWDVGFDLNMTWVIGYIGGQWVHLVPWYKQYTFIEGLDFAQIGGFDCDTYLDGIQEGATVNEAESWYTDLNYGYAQEYQTRMSTKVKHYIRENMAGANMLEVIGGRQIQATSGIPDTLPFALQSSTNDFSEIPDSLRYKIRFEMSGIDYTASTPQLAGKRLTIEYLPATDGDQSVIDSYDGLFNTPAYLVDMRAVLWIGGEPVDAGEPATLGDYELLQVHRIDPLYGARAVAKWLKSGAYYALGLNLGSISAALFGEHQEQISATTDIMESGARLVSRDEFLGEVLYIQALLYFMQVDSQRDLSARAEDVLYLRYPSFGYNEEKLVTYWSDGTPVAVERGGTGLDVQADVFNAYSTVGNRAQAVGWVMSNGALGSAWEHGLYELFQRVPGLSTIKVLQVASQQGVRAYRIDQRNASTILPSLEYSPWLTDTLREAIDEGRVVTVPQRDIQHHAWVGTGWIAMDESTGYAGYMLSGSISGGSSGQDPVDTFFGVAGPVLETVSKYYEHIPRDIGGGTIINVKHFPFDRASKLADKVGPYVTLADFTYSIGKTYNDFGDGKIDTDQAQDAIIDKTIQIEVGLLAGAGVVALIATAPVSVPAVAVAAAAGAVAIGVGWVTKKITDRIDFGKWIPSLWGD